MPGNPRRPPLAPRHLDTPTRASGRAAHVGGRRVIAGTSRERDSSRHQSCFPQPSKSCRRSTQRRASPQPNATSWRCKPSPAQPSPAEPRCTAKREPEHERLRGFALTLRIRLTAPMERILGDGTEVLISPDSRLKEPSRNRFSATMAATSGSQYPPRKLPESRGLTRSRRPVSRPQSLRSGPAATGVGSPWVPPQAATDRQLERMRAVQVAGRSGRTRPRSSAVIPAAQRSVAAEQRHDRCQAVRVRPDAEDHPVRLLLDLPFRK
jgi:hypothetical protein